MPLSDFCNYGVHVIDIRYSRTGLLGSGSSGLDYSPITRPLESSGSLQPFWRWSLSWYHKPCGPGKQITGPKSTIKTGLQSP